MSDALSPPVSPAARGAGLSQAMALLEQAADVLADVEPADLTDGELTEAMVALDAFRCRFDAARTALSGAWDARGVWALDGGRSGSGWLAARTESSKAAASGVLTLARRLRDMPATRAAFADGSLGTEKARLLARAAKAAPERFAVDETLLVQQASTLRVAQLRKALEFWVARADPDGAEADDAHHHAARGVHLSQTFEGMWRLDGQLTPEAGQILADALDRRVRELFDAARAQADAEGTVVSVTYPQLRADALVELATQAVTAAEHGGGLNVPAITALIDLAKLTDTHTCAGEPVGETDQGDKVTAEQARRLTCDCSLSRIVFDPTGATIDLGETARLPNPAMRRAIIARDRTCVFPGCDTPATRTHAHHLIHWTKDGPTDRDNLASLCSRHHHAVHEGGYGLTRAPDGSIHATRPDGTPLTVPKTNAPPPNHPWPRPNRPPSHAPSPAAATRQQERAPTPTGAR